MISTSFIDHASHVFFGSLGLALLVGLARSAAPRLTRGRRLARVIGVPLVYFALVMASSHVASFAPPTNAPAMAVALVSPVSRLTATRKVAAFIRENEKTDRAVEVLVALDLSIQDCRAAASDAYRYRARTTWPKVNQACGPSESAARALFEDGKLEEAALAFEAARNAQRVDGAWMAIDELTAYVLTKRSTAAGAALRALKPKSVVADDLECLANAVETYAGSTTVRGPASGSPECFDLHTALAPVSAPVVSGVPHPVATMTCAPRRDTEPRVDFRPDHSGVDAYSFRPDELVRFASEAGGSRRLRAQWLLQIDDYEGALEVANRELRTYTWNPPLYSKAVRDEHEALLASLLNEDPGNLWIRADCSKEIRVPKNHPLAQRWAKVREAYDAARDQADRINLRNRDQAAMWAYRLAVESLDAASAQTYFARISAQPSGPGELTTFVPDHRVELLLAFSSEAAHRVFDGSDSILHDAAVAGSGTRLAARLRALDASGEGTVDVIGKTIPEGRDSLSAFSRYDARLACDRRTIPMDQSAPRCSALALVRALGVRHRVARAVGDALTVRESKEALDRVIGHDGGAWLRDQRLAVVLDVADRLLTKHEAER